MLKKGSLICDARQEVTGAPGRVVPGNLEGIWSCGRHLGTGRGARKSDRATAEYHVLFCGAFPSFLHASVPPPRHHDASHLCLIGPAPSAVHISWLLPPPARVSLRARPDSNQPRLPLTL